MSRLLLTAIAVALSLLGAAMTTAPALAGGRVALIVGNSDYQHARKLPNPAKDAEAIAATFHKAGFDVVHTAYNVTNLEFKRAIRQFERAAADADIAVVYYAGHGVEINGTNYLIPIDAVLANNDDAEDEAISLDRVVDSVDGAKRLRVVILDACRDNPFGPGFRMRATEPAKVAQGEQCVVAHREEETPSKEAKAEEEKRPAKEETASRPQSRIRQEASSAGARGASAIGVGF